MQPPSVGSLLRQHASHASEVEVEFAAELINGIIEDTCGDDECARLKSVEEALADLQLCDDEVVAAVARQIVCPEVADATQDAKDDDAAFVVQLMEQYAVGKSGLALLDEDEEWHPVRIVGHRLPEHSETNSRGDNVTDEQHGMAIEVEFVEFGKKQVVQLDDLVLDEDVADDDSSEAPRECEMCERCVPLTEHHLIPRVTHAKYLKKGYSKDFLNTCIMICRACHSKIHSVEDNVTLAKSYNTLDKIMEHPEIIRWVRYAKKQKVRLKPIKKSK